MELIIIVVAFVTTLLLYSAYDFKVNQLKRDMEHKQWLMEQKIEKVEQLQRYLEDWE